VGDGDFGDHVALESGSCGKKTTKCGFKKLVINRKKTSEKNGRSSQKKY